MFLGDDLPAWLLLAFGGALAVGTSLALLRPPSAAVLAKQHDEDDDDASPITAQTRPPLGRSLIMIGVGVVCAVWALVSLIHGSS